MNGLIEIEDMEFFAYHGCFEAEQLAGNKFKLNVSIDYDCALPAKTDDVNDSLNYQKVYELVKKEVMMRSNLLENVAKRIIDVIFLNFPQARSVKVKVSKLNPPLGGKIGATSLTLSRSNS